jgi:glyoxylase-like metal-dependent hydrolase (beta-lactamase superfamily II)
MTKFAMFLLLLLPSTLVTSAQQPARSPGQLKQIIPGHYVYSSIVGGRFFNSGVIVTSEGVLVFDALESEATGRAEREAISSIIKQPVRLLVSSTFHDNYSKGNLAYSDVFKIGHENYRAGFIEQLQRGGASVEEQRARLPNQTFRDRVTLYLGGKEIQVLYLGSGHTRGDSIVFVPQDRIAYLSELFFPRNFRIRRRVMAPHGCASLTRSKLSQPISSCRGTVPFSKIQGKLEHNCTACGRYLSTHATLFRIR